MQLPCGSKEVIVSVRIDISRLTPGAVVMTTPAIHRIKAPAGIDIQIKKYLEGWGWRSSKDIYHCLMWIMKAGGIEGHEGLIHIECLMQRFGLLMSGPTNLETTPVYDYVVLTDQGLVLPENIHLNATETPSLANKNTEILVPAGWIEKILELFAQGVRSIERHGNSTTGLLAVFEDAEVAIIGNGRIPELSWKLEMNTKMPREKMKIPEAKS